MHKPLFAEHFAYLFIIESTTEDQQSESQENKNESSSLIPEKNLPKVIVETAKIGSVSKDVYLGYIKAGGTICTGLVLIISTIGMNGTYSLSGKSPINGRYFWLV